MVNLWFYFHSFTIPFRGYSINILPAAIRTNTKSKPFHKCIFIYMRVILRIVIDIIFKNITYNRIKIIMSFGVITLVFFSIIFDSFADSYKRIREWTCRMFIVRNPIIYIFDNIHLFF